MNDDNLSKLIFPDGGTITVLVIVLLLGFFAKLKSNHYTRLISGSYFPKLYFSYIDINKLQSGYLHTISIDTSSKNYES